MRWRAQDETLHFMHAIAAADKIAQTRENPKLPGIQLEKAIAVTSDLAQASRASAILLVTPAQSLREAAMALTPHLAKSTPVIVCAKGIERGTHQFMTEIVADVAPNAVPAILSGPSFDVDVARGLPTAVTLATADDALAQASGRMRSAPATFRPYHSPTCAVSRSAARPKTFWRSRQALSRAGSSAPPRWRR
jgi:glycerol-3-phosphate dehydrogenase (NAD(P)+)